MAAGDTRSTSRIDKQTSISLGVAGMALALTLSLLGWTSSQLAAAKQDSDARFEKVLAASSERLKAVEETTREMSYTLRQIQSDREDRFPLSAMRLWSLEFARANPTLTVPKPGE